MELTREQAIEEHRKMWQWIAEQYEKMEHTNYIGYSDCMNPFDLKEKYILENGHDDFSSVYLDCFLCEYTSELDDVGCENCPLDWGIVMDCIGTSMNRGLYGRLIDCHRNWDFKKCTELARVIAELPEKQ